MDTRPIKKYLPVACSRLLMFVALWMLLSGNSGWYFGTFCVLLATLVSVLLKPCSLPINWFYLPRFLVFFLSKSVLGGWDVARRALHPQLPIHPGWMTYTFVCPHPRVHFFLSAMVGLLPGTLTSHYDDSLMYIHALDQNQPWQETVAQLETHLTNLLKEGAA